MPLPERYAGEVRDMEAVWEPAGYFREQVRIWEAQSEARHELYGAPTAEQLSQIRSVLHLTDQDVADLNIAKGHETNRLLRLVQSRLSSEVGNFIHLGDTSSDVLDTSLSLQILKSLGICEEDFSRLGDSLRSLAIKHKGTLQIARTHGQHAIPHTFGRQVLGWYAEVRRGVDRINRAKALISYGKLSGEVGTNVYIEPELEELALSKLSLRPDEAPTQIISRDRHAEVVGMMAVNGATLARISTNIRLLSMTDIGELREPFDAESGTGSSAMPHKRNPEKSEREAGLNRRIRSTPGELLDASISWLERDISHSSTERFLFPDLFCALSYQARLGTEVINGLVVNSDRMLANLDTTYGAIYSSRLLNALLDSNKFSRTQGYELVKALSQQAIDQRVHLQKLALLNPKIIDAIGEENISQLFDPAFYLRNIDVAYRRLGVSE